MLSIRMRAPDRVPSAKPLGFGFITGHRLTFDKVSEDQSGKCDAQATGDRRDRVYGVLYAIDKSEKRKLDAVEGFGNGYDEKTVRVAIANGLKRAVMYYATRKDPARRPYHWYKAFVVSGAVEHGLPFSYIEWLRTTESVEDQNAERRFKNERLLAAEQLTAGSTRARAKSALASQRGR